MQNTCYSQNLPLLSWFASTAIPLRCLAGQHQLVSNGMARGAAIWGASPVGQALERDYHTCVAFITATIQCRSRAD